MYTSSFVFARLIVSLLESAQVLICENSTAKVRSVFSETNKFVSSEYVRVDNPKRGTNSRFLNYASK